jgi:hypothetical protein
MGEGRGRESRFGAHSESFIATEKSIPSFVASNVIRSRERDSFFRESRVLSVSGFWGGMAKSGFEEELMAFFGSDNLVDGTHLRRAEQKGELTRAIVWAKRFELFDFSSISASSESEAARKSRRLALGLHGDSDVGNHSVAVGPTEFSDSSVQLGSAAVVGARGQQSLARLGVDQGGLFSIGLFECKVSGFNGLS